jgi:phage gpG-like protein
MSIESGAANKLSKKKLTIRSGLKKANLHHYGGRTKLGTYVPSRKFLYFDEFDHRMVKRIFVDYIEEVADGVDQHQV